MKNILFVANTPLDDPIRGTPLRIVNYLRQINKEHNLLVCAKDIDKNLNLKFIDYPALAGYKKLRFFIDLVRKNNIDIILTATETGIKLPILLKLFTGKKIAIDMHGLYHEELFFAGKIGEFKKNLYEFLIKFYLRFYDLVTVVSGKLKSYYENINNNIAVIYGGVNLDEFGNAGRVKTGVFTIGYMGNSRPYQGLDFLLDAAGEIKKGKLFNFKLNLVISGERESIIKKLEKLDLREEAILKFDIPHEKVNEVISQSDVLVIPRPSLKMTEYAYPSKFPEYLLTSVPLIITDVGPIREFSNCKFCILIDKENIEGNLISELELFYKKSEIEKAEIGQNAIKFVKDNLTWDIIGKKINSSLENI